MMGNGHQMFKCWKRLPVMRLIAHTFYVNPTIVNNKCNNAETRAQFTTHVTLLHSNMLQQNSAL